MSSDSSNGSARPISLNGISGGGLVFYWMDTDTRLTIDEVRALDKVALVERAGHRGLFLSFNGRTVVCRRDDDPMGATTK